MKKSLTKFMMLLAVILLPMASWAQTYQSVPYSTGFEDLSTGGLPTGWVNYATGTSGSGTFPSAYAWSGNAHNSSVYFEFEYSSSSSQREEITATPEFADPSGLMVSFWLGSLASYAPDTFQVGIMEDSVFVPVQTIDIVHGSSWSDYTQYRVYLNTYTGTGHRIAFRAYRASGQLTLMMDDLTIANLPGCAYMPGAVSVTTDSTSATLTWGAAQSSANYMIYLANDSSWYSASDTTYTLTGLTANTAYSGYVYNSCTGADTSEAVAFSFRTDCGMPVLPFTENFDTYGGSFPSCWQITETAGSWTTYPYVYSYGSHSGNYGIYFYGGYGQHSIASPKIYQAINTIDVQFYAHTNGSYYSNLPIQVGYIDNLDSIANAVIVDTVIIPDQDWDKYTVTFRNVSATYNGYVIFRMNTSSYGGIIVDDITIRPSRTCADPTNLHQTGTASGSLSVAWDDTLASSWEVAVAPMGFNPDTLSSYVTASADTITLTGLEDTITYDIYVRADCGTEQSYWVGPISARPNLYVMTANASDTVHMCGGTITDDGGLLSDFSEYQTSYLVIYPSDSTQTVTLTGDVDMYESSWGGSTLTVYEGVGTSGRVIATYTTSNNTNVSCASTVGAITLKLESSYYTASGFQLTVSCQTLSNCTDPYDVAVSDIAGASAVVSWGYGSVSNPTSFTITATDTASGSVLTFTAPDTARSYQISGLEQTTTYYLTVTANCGSDESNPTGVYFTTKCLAGGDIQVGDGVASLSTHPINTYYNYSLCQIIYDAADLIQVSDTIYGVGFYANSAASGNKSIDIYIDTTSVSTYASSSSFITMADSNRHFSGSVTLQSGWNEFHFTTPFVRPNTTSNLVVTIDNNTGSYNSNSYWAGLGGCTGKTLYQYADGTNCDPTGAPSMTGVTDNRPNILFYTPCADASCIAPSVVLGTSTPNSVTLNWVPGSNETSWSVDYALYSDTTWTTFLATTSATTATVTGLNPATHYKFRVSSLCSSDAPYSIVNGWSGCSAITSLPFTEDFESFTATSGDPSTQPCWNRGTNYTSSWYTYYYPCTYTSYHHSGTTSLNMYAYSYSSASSWIVLPEMGVSVDSLLLTFYMLGTYPSWNTYNAIIGVMTDPSNINTFVATDTVSYSGDGSTWMQVERAFHNYDSNGRYIAIMSDPSTSSWYLDDIRVELDNPCAHPLNFTVDSVSTTTASISWSDTANVGSYIIKIGTANDLSTVFDSATVAVNHHTFTGLTRATDYYVWVYTNCSVGASNPLSGRVTTLTTNPLTLPFTADFESTNMFNLYTRTGSNFWTVDTAASNGGTHGLYVTNDSITNAYDHSTSSVSFAYVPVVLPGDSVYAIAFDWLGKGEAGFDGMRAALAPATTDFTTAPSSYSDYRNDLPTGWIALDGGVLNNQNTWQSFSNDTAISAGTYFLTFVWFNDGSAGTDPAAAVDNIDFRLLTCPGITDLEATAASTSTITLDWNSRGSESQWEVEYGLVGFDHGTGNSVMATSHPFILTGLTATTEYDIYVRPVCSATDSGLWVKGTFMTSFCDGIEYTTFGNQDSTVTLGQSYYVPVNNYYNYSVTEIILDSADLGGATDFGAVEFYLATSNAVTDKNDVDIYIQPTSLTTFSTTADFVNRDSATAVLVYHGALNAVQGWNTFQFTNTYQYDGNGNLVMIIDDNSNDYNSSSMKWATRPDTTGNKTWSIWNDNTNYDVDSLTTASYSNAVYAYRPEMRLLACGASCPMPAVSSTVVDYESVTLNWSSQATEFEVAIKNHADLNWPAATSVVANTYTFTGLYPETDYDVRVRALCDSATSSNWLTRTIHTDSLPCFVVTNVHTTATTVNSVSVAWDNNANSSASAWVVNVFNSTQNIMDTVMTNPATISGLYDNTEYSVSVQSMCSALIYSEFSDTITFTTPVCTAVSGVAVNNITANSAQVTWNAGGSETSWEVSYGEMDFAQGTGTTVTVNTRSYTITGLQADNYYDVYVRSVCADGIQSDWSPVAQFQTQSEQNGIDGVEGSYSLNIYPNPTSGNTTISLRGVEGQVTISVVDMNGRTISSEVMNCGADCVKTMNVEGLAQGTYFVRVLGDGINSVRKLVVR